MKIFGIILLALAVLGIPTLGQETQPLLTDGLQISTGNKLVDIYINQAAKEHDVDPLLIYAQMDQESKFKSKARSRKGARGLMQLMPATARRFGVKNSFDKRENVFAGVRYMRWLLDRFDGDVELALAGYNAGEGAVIKYGYTVPPFRETKKYVKKITQHYEALRENKQLAVF